MQLQGKYPSFVHSGQQSYNINPLAFFGHAIVNDQNQRKKKLHQPIISSCKETLPKTLKSDEVLVKVTRTSICQTDRRVLAKQKKHGLSDHTFCLGHEGGGRVVVAANKSSSDFQAGQKVVFLPHYSCMTCFQCQRGNTNLCPDMKHMGIHSPGVFSHFVAQPARCLYSLPEIFEDDLVPLVEPLACAIRGWSRIESPSGPIAIYGSGPMGVLIALYAKRVFPSVSVDLIEVNPTRAKAVLQSTGMKTIKKPRSKYRLAVIASSELQAYETGISHLVSGGQVMAFSGINLQDLNSGKARVFEDIHRQEKTMTIAEHQVKMVGTSGYTREDIAMSVRELSQYGDHYKRVQNSTLEGLLSHSLKMNDGKVVHCDKPAIVELLQTDPQLNLTRLQSSVLKLLIRMD